MSSTDIFPRKWSMRYSCDSSISEWRVAFSSRADARSWPNGFSTTTRAFFVIPAFSRPPTTVPKSEGGISR